MWGIMAPVVLLESIPLIGEKSLLSPYIQLDILLATVMAQLLLNYFVVYLHVYSSLCQEILNLLVVAKPFIIKKISAP